MLKDKGHSNAGAVPCPAVLTDIEGNGRPRDGGWDIGPYEYQGTVVTPEADFHGACQGVNGDQRRACPARPRVHRLFQRRTDRVVLDLRTGKGTSTTQNPTHTYNTPGQYTVTLAATNDAGTTTYSNHLHHDQGPESRLHLQPHLGRRLLAVRFTDQRTNSPTSWSWTFGDGKTVPRKTPPTPMRRWQLQRSLTATNTWRSDTAPSRTTLPACDTDLLPVPAQDRLVRLVTRPNGNRVSGGSDLRPSQQGQASNMDDPCDTAIRRVQRDLRGPYRATPRTRCSGLTMRTRRTSRESPRFRV